MINVYRFCVIALLSIGLLSVAYAGEPVTGDFKYELKTKVQYDSYKLTDGDRNWISSLVRNLHYSGEVVVFVKTNLPLFKNGQRVENQVYQSLEDDAYYIIDGNTLIETKNGDIFMPGAGGTSLHSPKSRNFIVFLNYGGGLGFENVHIDLENGEFVWYGDGYKWQGL